MAESNEYSVPQESERLFHRGILDNSLMQNLPKELKGISKTVRFQGHARPTIPVNWRWTESISALKALEATMLNLLITRKYHTDAVAVTINTDHASLFIMSPSLARVVGEEQPVTTNGTNALPGESLHRMAATNIYRTRDDRFYHVHGSMNPDYTLAILGLPPLGDDADTYDDAISRLQDKVSQFDAAPLDHLMNDQHRQAGTIAYSTDEYFASEHGRANSKAGFYDILKDANSSQPAAWWPENSSLPSSIRHPLAGLKVVDLTRIFAGPTMTKDLAEMGASVMRVTSPHVPDFPRAFNDLNWGKWNCSLHLKDEADKNKLCCLIADADVVVDGYRPGVMDKLGFGREDIFALVRDRDRGIIHLRENCYGWNGPWAHRSGWQGISDACCGISLGYGQAMGLNEPVTPCFPNSDRCTGVIGSVAILQALIQRAEQGGSYGIDTSLNYYSQWLARTVGTYPPQTWHELWRRHDSPVFRSSDNTRKTVPTMLALLRQHDADLFDPDFFAEYYSAPMRKRICIVRPVARFEHLVELGYNVGTRGNGVDEPVWPEDLGVEIVV